MTDAATEKSSATWKKTLMKLVSAASFISLGWMGPGLVDQFTGNAPQDKGTGETPEVTITNMQRVQLSEAEANGLLVLGAAYGANLGNLRDGRDLCRVTKANAALTNGGQQDYSAEFERCAGRNLHFDAALLQAGALAGLEGLQQAGPGDYCALKEIAAMRADFKNALETGQALPPHDETLQAVNGVFSACQGEFKIDNQKWNTVANQMVLVPFYKKAPGQ